ncbi:hypothetical protein ACJRO7_024695 [Eucalyptus globulus]|uniref:Wall-associated receptor kinase galacturonan-binding domain-containing protein n=1 Tax=Eucalyptus globulus TaxID=34317 RepID=A0ABD3KF56_EUCGL
MHRRVLLLITAATALLLLLLLPLPPTASSFSAGNSLSNCNRTFSCSPLVNVSYLFTGGDCPAHCGPPEFHLSCIGDYPELTAGSLTYHVQALNETTACSNTPTPLSTPPSSPLLATAETSPCFMSVRT